jgi:glycosyltransferase involved in cell wall biosynthesis
MKTLQNSIDALVLSKKFPPTVFRKKYTIPFAKQIETNEVLIISSFPPRECGIANYTKDLVNSLEIKFKSSINITVCPLESNSEQHNYNQQICSPLNVDDVFSFQKTLDFINTKSNTSLVIIQHEFGFFNGREDVFFNFISSIVKPVIIVFHTVLPLPNLKLKIDIQKISDFCESIIVMTKTSATILKNEYEIMEDKISVIPHGTHLINHTDKIKLKKKYLLNNKLVLSTFGLISSGKSIETTLYALPKIIEKNPNVMFLIIGITHPTVVKNEAEKYRIFLSEIVLELNLEQHVRFINKYLPLSELLEYLQLSDVYLFTSKDPNQAVSGTFSYAISCGCPVVSTPIPHAKEVIKNDNGIIFNFENSEELASAVIRLLNDENLRKNISSNSLHSMASTAWENSAIAHALLFNKFFVKNNTLEYRLPKIDLSHLDKLTTDFGIIQFSKINHPDITSGFTLDDNARALITVAAHFKLTNEEADLARIKIYLNFLDFCLQEDGTMLNYVDENYLFTPQNYLTNLEDSNGRAVWSLGYLLSISNILPSYIIQIAENIFERVISNFSKNYSSRAMAFAIKGLHLKDSHRKESKNKDLIVQLSNRLVQMYKHESKENWNWFESYLTYANSILPEALLCAWQVTNDKTYLDIAKDSFDFLVSKIFIGDEIKVISNKNWMSLDTEFNFNSCNLKKHGGEQPIDVAYTIFALEKFYEVFKNEDYFRKINVAFSWFLGNNHLHQIVYNPCTAGCYDGVEEENVNLNQGSESTVSYLLARIKLEHLIKERTKKVNYKDFNLNSILL